MTPTADPDRSYARNLIEAVSAELFGVEDVTRLIVTALMTRGHVLLEGHPGLGKTRLVRALTRALGFSVDESYRRIQFTPDLMPFDITGTYQPDFQNPKDKELIKGPIFGSLILADEINRASPKTQSALLEAMAERQVTILGKDHPLPTPFIVLATQNPIDHEGTYDLPEAQLDRFMFKILMQPQGAAVLRRILKASSPDPKRLHQTSAVSGDPRRWIPHLQSRIADVTPVAELTTHIINLSMVANGQRDQTADVDVRQREELKEIAARITQGLSPRAAFALLHGTMAWSFLFLGENHAVGQGLGMLARAALRHRLRFEIDWDSQAADAEQLLTQFILATAPKKNGYQEAVQEGLENGL